MILLKFMGAVLVIGGCGGAGFSMAAIHNKEYRYMHKLINILDYMSCELQYRLTPLPDLCMQVAKESTGLLATLFYQLAVELNSQIKPDVRSCMITAMASVRGIPKRTQECLLELSASMGRFDLQGQIRGLEALRLKCRAVAEELNNNRASRLRSYRTLGLCAGAALAILFL